MHSLRRPIKNTTPPSPFTHHVTYVMYSLQHGTTASADKPTPRERQREDGALPHEIQHNTHLCTKNQDKINILLCLYSPLLGLGRFF
jgi:hypothetical protein